MSQQPEPKPIWYEPLQEQDEIRILRLEPGDEGSPVICTLIHVTLSERPVYDALSYQWGSEDVLKYIDIQGTAWRVRENLYWALSHLIYRGRVRMLWVDALCINQADILERGHQVYQMKRIYTLAKRVCVWLGLADGGTREAVQFLTSLEIEQDALNSIFTGSLEIRKHLAFLSKNEYWDRLWIIQEVVLAQRIVIYSGNLKFPWTTLSHVVSFLCDKERVQADSHFHESVPVWAELFNQPVAHSTMAKLCAERQLRNTFHSPLLFHLVERYEGAKCTDLRDNVFGLLSFAIFCCKDAISIDYACSGYQLCNRLLEHHHQAHGHEEEILRMVKRTENIQKLILDRSSENTKSISNLIVGGPHEVNIGCATVDIEGFLLPKGAIGEGRYETQTLRRVSGDELPGFRAEWVTQEMNEPVVLLDDNVYAQFTSGIVCRFLDSKIQAFVRKEMDRYRLLGRVVSLKEVPFSLVGGAPGFKGILLNLDIPTLQLLTCPPKLLQIRNRP